ncbi:hypothetical protein [Blastochloris sulfoviridis]|uniref:hypothetical protein n=1 Tax=Blastochloris sulfoviridis TaxID=50712 RepID=UPI001FE566CB|nr:hypothetical protein [Blastochloris sulfoviridis]
MNRTRPEQAHSNGSRRRNASIAEAFAGELLGLEELETGDHVVRFCAHDVGLIDRRGLFRRFAPPRTGLREAAEQTANPNPDLSTIIPVQSVDHLPG